MENEKWKINPTAIFLRPADEQKARYKAGLENTALLPSAVKHLSGENEVCCGTRADIYPNRFRE
jgi:hypothetical protein